MYSHQLMNLSSVLRGRHDAVAIIRGSETYPAIGGTIRFFDTNLGVLVSAEISGLPKAVSKCREPIFALHIHSGESCSGNAQDPFANAGTHLNPENCPHPYHAGDMPPLFGADGYAYLSFLSNRFSIRDILGKTVIVHSNPDDFTTQPSGNAGEKIACGVIRSA